MRELQWRRQHVPLSDARDHGLARKPDLHVLALEGLLLPVARGQQRRALAGDVDARLLAEAEPGEEIVHAVDAEPLGEPVEIHVAGLGNRRVHVHRAMPALFPVAITVAVASQLEVAAAELGLVGLGDAVFEPGERNQRLDGRAGRVNAAQCAIVEGHVDALGERGVFRV